MTGRVYLDHNATAPLRPEARDAMIAAMEVVGNPSSVHAEGRAAKALLERARAQLGAALGAGEADIVFTSGATEAAALALRGRGLAGGGIEHDAVRAWIADVLPVDRQGRVLVEDPAASTVQLANSETGIIQRPPEGLAVSDLTQGFGKVPFSFAWSGISMGIVSAHKIGGPRGIGALIMRRGTDPEPLLRGGGQERGWRAGTENLVAIAGFGAAAEAAMRDLEAGVGERIEKLRNILEKTIEAEAAETIFVGKGRERLPNTSCFVTPGWKGETQVMQMDLAGFAVSAGSACSSGKVRASHALRAMGMDEVAAASALRVSLGPQTSEGDILRFCDAWIGTYRRRFGKAA